MIITILTDNLKSWFVPYAKQLIQHLSKLGHNVSFVTDKTDILKGDVCLLLCCVKIIEQDYLSRNKNNIVIHASDLPSGKGFSPLQWQILEGKNEIVLTLFEVVPEVDAGPYYLKDKVNFNGSELFDKLRDKIGLKMIEMIIYFINNRDSLKKIPQCGERTWYERRKTKDDEIDPNKSIAEQFNHFRIADNENYPLYFILNGTKYFLKIYED